METPEMGWRIRPSRVGDFEAVMGLYDAAVVWLNERGITEQWGVTPVSSRPHLVAEVRESLNGGTIAENAAGEIVGFIAAEFPDSDGAAYIHSLVARRTPDARGAGAALLRWAELRAANEGIKILRLHTRADNSRLVAYYESQGFVRAATDVEDATAVLLEKSVGE